MKIIMQYKFFDSNKDFVSWQEEQSIQLYSVLPIIHKADSINSPNETVESFYYPSVFVTFTYINGEVDDIS